MLAMLATLWLPPATRSANRGLQPTWPSLFFYDIRFKQSIGDDATLHLPAAPHILAKSPVHSSLMPQIAGKRPGCESARAWVQTNIINGTSFILTPPPSLLRATSAFVLCPASRVASACLNNASLKVEHMILS